MKELLTSSIYFGLLLTLFTFCIGLFVQKKTHFILLNPLIISVTLTIITLVLLKIPYDDYKESSKMIGNMLTPATVVLAIPLYRKFQQLKDNYLAILIGITAGVISHLFIIFGLCFIFKIGHTEYVSLLPKSITTAIAVALTEMNNGIPAITILMVSIAGNLGNIFAVQFARLFHITDPIAKGVAIGSSSHAMGTSKALEIGETEGAMSGLSIAVTGVLTVVFVPFFVNLI